MGSKITRSIYKKQRAIKPTQQHTIKLTRYFSYVLYIYSAFTIGYIEQIDYILRHKMKQLFKYQPELWFKILQSSLNCLSPIFVGVLASLIGNAYFLLQSSFLCLLSQILIYVSISRVNISLMLIGQLIFNFSSIGVIISLLGLIKKNIAKQISIIFVTAILSIINIGEHSSNYLTPIISNNALDAVYIISGVFGIIGLMSVGIIYIFEKYILSPKKMDKNKKKSYILEKQNLNFASIKFMGISRLKSFFKQAGLQICLLILSSMLISLLDNSKVETYTTDHLAYNALICLGTVFISVLFYFFGNRLRITLLINILYGVLYYLNYSNENKLIVLQAIIRINEAVIINVLATIVRIQHYAISIGFYLFLKHFGQLLIIITTIETFEQYILMGVILINLLLIVKALKKHEMEDGNAQQFTYSRIQ